MYLIVQQAHLLEIDRHIVVNTNDNSQFQEFLNSLQVNIFHPLAILLAQIITIIVVARIFGWLFKKIGQPSVIGEILAGIVLGPSLLGLYYPEFFDQLFPKSSLGNLEFISQIGLILFMFVIGMELDLKVLKKNAKDAIIISHASIIFPFTLGMGLAYYIYQEFAPDGVQFLSFALFLGIAMSITAFPVLARIVQERGMSKTRLGSIVITCAAADDITAWCLLAAVIAIVKAGNFVSSLYVLALATAYVILMIKVVKPFLKRIGDLHSTKASLTKSIVGIFFLVLLLSAYSTEVIGIHALFGAFMAGAIMPENVKFRNLFIEKVEDVSLVLLLPLFFVFTGLRTQIGLLGDLHLWKITGLIILVAVVGKFIGSALAARFIGQNWKDSLSIGALMNTRGLMELVVLNIGYDLGVLTPEIFAMMVVMALVTTFMTGPALDLINRIFKSSPDAYDELSQVSKYKILNCFESPDKGVKLLRLSHYMIQKNQENSLITSLHLVPSSDIHQYHVEQMEKEIFSPVIEESEDLDQPINTLFKVSNDMENDILDISNKGDYDLLLIGIKRSIYEGSVLGKVLGYTSRIINPDRLLNQVKGRERFFDTEYFDEKTRGIIARSKIPVGVLVDKNLDTVQQIFIPIFSKKDGDLIKYAQRFITNADAQIHIIDIIGLTKYQSETKEIIRAIEQLAPQHIHLYYKQKIDKEFLENIDLMLIGLDSWKEVVGTKSVWISSAPSTLIIAN